MRLRAGILPQHLGKADSLYWTTLLRGRLNDNQLRLLIRRRLNIDYRRSWYHTAFTVGQPFDANNPPSNPRMDIGAKSLTAERESLEVLIGARLNDSGNKTYEIDMLVSGRTLGLHYRYTWRNWVR